jgi:hypothetical protein
MEISCSFGIVMGIVATIHVPKDVNGIDGHMGTLAIDIIHPNSIDTIDSIVIINPISLLISILGGNM